MSDMANKLLSLSLSLSLSLTCMWPLWVSMTHCVRCGPWPLGKGEIAMQHAIALQSYVATWQIHTRTRGNWNLKL